MNRPGVLARVAAMDREELRVRLIEAMRKYAGRVEYSIRPPQWSRGRITRILDRGAGPEVARAIDAAEARIRAAVPIARVIYLEPDIYRSDYVPAERPEPPAPAAH